MKRKSKQRLLFRVKIVAICGAIAFMVGGVMDCYSKAWRKADMKETAATIIQEEAVEIVIPKTIEDAEPEIQENIATEYHGVAGSVDWDSEDAYLLAKIAMAEAEGEDMEGKALVMLVVLNRVWSNEFPDSISEVIFQKGQFSPVSSGRYERVEPNQECFEALNMIQEEKWDESQGALYFESKSKSSWHRDNLQFLFQHGNHYFYK